MVDARPKRQLTSLRDEAYDSTYIARGASRLRVRKVGRPSQPDLGNTSVGKPVPERYCEHSAALLL
ncbi:hypothetical protein NITMOv2_0949 [Nitrospira moscoviensis]|uniref:Uncharacterized protein n=1 Tax=Nitrospira moscoviensis TaxID=42253 RepID=A0A0K2G8U9_NITMO|nr:hypothetical protein NITMOv2_0949 [Nitrospira moscoviensis]